MRIGDGSSGPIDTGHSKVRDASTAPGAGQRAQAQSGDTQPGDTVELGDGRTLLQLTLQVGSSNRRGRVEEVREKLAAGNYQASSEEISRAMVEDMLSTNPLETSST